MCRETLSHAFEAECFTALRLVKWGRECVKSLANFYNLGEEGLLLMLLGIENFEKMQFDLPFLLQLDTKD